MTRLLFFLIIHIFRAFFFLFFFPLFSQMNSKPKQKASWNIPSKPVFISRDLLSRILFPLQSYLRADSSPVPPPWRLLFFSVSTPQNPEGNKVKQIGYLTFAWLLPEQDEWADCDPLSVLIYVDNFTSMCWLLLFLVGKNTHHTSSFPCSSPSGKSCNLTLLVLKRQKQDNNILFLCIPTDVCFTVSCAINWLKKTCKYSI